MILKQRLLIVCTISVILLLIVQHCDAARSSSSRKSTSGRGSSSGRGTSTGSSGNSGSSGSWWSRVTGGGSSSSSSASKVSSSATQKKPEPSAPRYEEKKHIGWNVQGVNNNPGAPPPYSNTHTKGLSNPNLQNAPPYSKNNPPGHQTIQSNHNPNQQSPGYPVQSNVQGQYPGINYQKNVGQQSAGYPVQSNVQGQYPGINYPRNVGQQQSGYPGGAYQGGHYPNQGGYYPNQGGHYSGMNYGGGSYPGYSGYSPAAPNGYFASGYPVTILSGNNGRSGSGSTLTNALLAGTVGLGLYNAIRPYPSYAGSSYGSYGGGGLAGGGSTVHNHYYNSQAPGSNTNPAQAPVQNNAQAPVQAAPSNQNTNAVQTPLAPMPDQAGVPLANNAADPTNALVTPPPPALAPNDKITDLDCVYAMKILNCSEIPQCPQEWIHPSCLNRTISKEYFDSITLPPPPPPQPMPEANPIPQEKLSGPTDLTQNKNGERNLNVYSANGQQMPVVSPSSSSSKASATGYSLCFAIFFGIATLKSVL